MKRKQKRNILTFRKTKAGEIKRKSWQDKLDTAKRMYEDERKAMDEREAYYNGTHFVASNRNTSQVVKKQSTNVRNIMYELVESQIDSTIPLPRVEAIHPEDEELAREIEIALRNEIRILNFKELNDQEERTVPIQGGSYMHVEWDNEAGWHCTLGELSVTDRHPKQIIPQPGIYDLEKMDYVFLLLAQSRNFLEKKYGVDLQGIAESNPEVRGADESVLDEMCTQNIVYYRNQSGGIGRYSWVEDITLEDREDYYAREVERCSNCGAIREGDTCVECGSGSFHAVREDFEELTGPLTLRDGTKIEAFSGEREIPVMDAFGNPAMDEQGIPMMQTSAAPTRIPYYKPSGYPLILRRNIRKYGTLLGSSDVDIIRDQQEAIKKLGSKIDEKILRGGSFVTLPDGVKFETTDQEFKVVRLKNSVEKALIDVITVQPDVSKEMASLENNYQWAKSTLGITDSFQGKYDSSATSGTAKQFSANQAAGRLQSKREMKNAAYTELYRKMFQFWLAYADQPIPVSYKAPDGTTRFSHFDRYHFLKQDAAGAFYWDDEFIFSIDPSATLASNREQLWTQIDLKYQSGAFGPITEPESRLLYWTLLAETGYPHGDTMKELISQQIQQQEIQPQILQKGGGELGAMSGM